MSAALRTISRTAANLLAACLMLSGRPSSAEPLVQRSAAAFAPTLDRLVTEAAVRSGFPAAWIAAVVRVESAGDVRAVSPKGAMGLMQLMPATWSDMRLRYGLGADPFEPRDNLLAGAAYLRELYDRYGPRGFLAAYNAGPGRYERASRRIQALPRETVDYVARLQPIVGEATTPKPIKSVLRPRSWRVSDLFAAHPSSVPALVSTPRRPPSDVTHRNALAPAAPGLFVTVDR